MRSSAVFLPQWRHTHRRHTTRHGARRSTRRKHISVEQQYRSRVSCELGPVPHSTGRAVSQGKEVNNRSKRLTSFLARRHNVFSLGRRGAATSSDSPRALRQFEEKVTSLQPRCSLSCADQKFITRQIPYAGRALAGEHHRRGRAQAAEEAQCSDEVSRWGLCG